MGEVKLKETLRVRLESDKIGVLRRGRDARVLSLPLLAEEGHVGTQAKGSHLQANKRALPRNQTCWHLGIRLPLTSRTMRKKVPTVSPLSLYYPIMAAPSRLLHGLQL